MTTKNPVLIVNFGGPRSLDEVKPFLQTLLCDQDVVRTQLPQWLHNLVFKFIASKRTAKVCKDYASIGGKSPIYFDTEEIAQHLRQTLNVPVWTFHRYLPSLHQDFLKNFIQESKGYNHIQVVPMFPQFTYATTGSIARWLQENLPREITHKLVWHKSYPDDPDFIHAYAERIKEVMEKNNFEESKMILLASAHGVPEKFIKYGDPYQKECERTFKALAQYFPKALCRLSYQSKFGPEEWIKPYTEDVCHDILHWNENRHQLIVVPIAFTSDHIETLFEIDQEYLPILKQRGIHACRAQALNHHPLWLKAVEKLCQKPAHLTTQMLVNSFCKWQKICPKFGKCACPKNT